MGGRKFATVQERFLCKAHDRFHQEEGISLTPNEAYAICKMMQTVQESDYNENVCNRQFLILCSSLEEDNMENLCDIFHDWNEMILERREQNEFVSLIFDSIVNDDDDGENQKDPELNQRLCDIRSKVSISLLESSRRFFIQQWRLL